MVSIMEENIRALDAAISTPEEAAPPDEASPAPSASPAEGAAPTGEAAMPPEGTDAPAEQEEAAPPVIHAKYNKQERAYSLDEARPLVEKGLKYDAIKADYDRLRYFAKSLDIGVPDLVERLMKSADDKMYSDILKECDGNETAARQLFAYRKNERDQKFARYQEEDARQEAEDAEAAGRELTQRLAKEYLELSREFPGQFAQFQDVPQAVVNDAVRRRIPLLDAYLRFQHRETVKTQRAKSQQADAKQSSAGSMSSEPEQAQADFSDFSAAFRSALF